MGKVLGTPLAWPVYLIPILNILLKLKKELWSGENWPWPHSLSEAISYGLEWILIVNPHAVNSREKATRPIDAHHTEIYSLRPSTAALYPIGDCKGPAAEFYAQIGLTTYFHPRGLVLFRNQGVYCAWSTDKVDTNDSISLLFSTDRLLGYDTTGFLAARGLVARLGGSRLSGSLGRLTAYSVAWLFKNKSSIQGARTHTLEAMHMVSYYPASLSIYQDRRLNGHLWEKAIGGVRTRLLYMAFERLSCLNQASGHVMICN
ncbi:hypothetical protein VNO77_08355 [Canavalia gladiata]|uniref:Uncharacterized protein n=1 Tax=Canavalia gladiata TaxID=3824 RepID=A0AAN9MC64_CANGL